MTHLRLFLGLPKCPGPTTNLSVHLRSLTIWKKLQPPGLASPAAGRRRISPHGVVATTNV